MIAQARDDCTCAMRRDGVQVLPRSCRVCGLGPCRFVEPVAMVPNRLKGATINQDGDAI